MTQTDVRDDPLAIDAAWMTEAMESAGVARGAQVTSVEFLGFVGTGQMSRNARLSLSWDRPGDDRPTSVVGKFPSDDPAAREGAYAYGSYFHEFVFYSELASTVDVATPACFVARYDAETRNFVLILEDMVGCEQGNQLTGCSEDEIDLAIEQAVGLHAPRWGDPTLPQLPGLAPSGHARGAMLDGFYGAAYRPGLDRLGHGLDDDVVELVRWFAPQIARWTVGTGTPHTIVHADFRPDNFLFGRTPEARPLVVVDWQTTFESVGPLDIAYLIGGALAPDERARVERDLLRDYCARINARGIEYAGDDCWRDYRWGTLWGVLIAVMATVMAEVTERGDAMLTHMIASHARHALDLDVMTLFD